MVSRRTTPCNLCRSEHRTTRICPVCINDRRDCLSNKCLLCHHHWRIPLEQYRIYCSGYAISHVVDNRWDVRCHGHNCFSHRATEHRGSLDVHCSNKFSSIFHTSPYPRSILIDGPIRGTSSYCDSKLCHTFTGNNYIHLGSDPGNNVDEYSSKHTGSSQICIHRRNTGSRNKHSIDTVSWCIWGDCEYHVRHDRPHRVCDSIYTRSNFSRSEHRLGHPEFTDKHNSRDERGCIEWWIHHQGHECPLDTLEPSDGKYNGICQ